MSKGMVTSSEVTLEAYCDLMESSSVLSSVDIGVAVIYQVSHPTHGCLTLVNAMNGRSAVIK